MVPPPEELYRPPAESIADQYLKELSPTHGGRYSELSDVPTVTNILRAAATGLRFTDCARAAGIHPDTLKDWIGRGENAPDSAFGLLVTEIHRVKSMAKAKLLEQIAEHGTREWTANAWMLERTDQDQFAIRKGSDDAPKVVVQIGVRDSDVRVNVVSASPAALPAADFPALGS